MSDQPSIFYGLSQSVLQAYLASAQAAYVELMSGKSAASVSYAQGDGSKSVTYRAADIANLQKLIRMLQLELGIITRQRRAIRPVF